MRRNWLHADFLILFMCKIKIWKFKMTQPNYSEEQIDSFYALSGLKPGELYDLLVEVSGRDNKTSLEALDNVVISLAGMDRTILAEMNPISILGLSQIDDLLSTRLKGILQDPLNNDEIQIFEKDVFEIDREDVGCLKRIPKLGDLTLAEIFSWKAIAKATNRFASVDDSNIIVSTAQGQTRAEIKKTMSTMGRARELMRSPSRSDFHRELIELIVKHEQ